MSEIYKISYKSGIFEVSDMREPNGAERCYRGVKRLNRHHVSQGGSLVGPMAEIGSQ